MGYKASIDAYIDTLKAQADLMKENTCHYGASGTINTLGQSETEKTLSGQPNLDKDADGPYRLDIKTVEPGDSTGLTHASVAWDHSLVVMRADGELVLFQCFSRQYSMGDWLKLEGNVTGSPCGLFYSPGSSSVSTDSIKQWLKNLACVAPYYNGRKWKDFNTMAMSLFCSPKPGPFDEHANELRANVKSTMENHWRYYKLAEG